MADDEEYEIAPDRVAVKESEWDALVAFHQTTMATMRALFADDQAGYDRQMALLAGGPVFVQDLATALMATIRERDAARRAVRMLEDHGKTWTAALVRGEV